MRSAADTACELTAFECISMDQSSVVGLVGIVNRMPTSAHGHAGCALLTLGQLPLRPRRVNT